MSHLNTPYESDLDSFLNLDNTDFTPISPSTNTKPIPHLKHQVSSSSSNNFANLSTPQTFSGPSFQYDAHRQQTGLPIGGLANTFAVNRASGLQYFDGHGGFVMPTETLNMPLSNLEDFDFSHNPSVDMSDIDFEPESPSDLTSMFYPSGSSSQGQFVSPNTLLAQSSASSSSSTVQRIYPGMHSQQAAQAKAQQVQKQQQMQRQQQQPRQIPGQKPLPSQPKAQPTKDPLVEESISRLLSQMRQNSTANSAEDDDSPAGMSNVPRIKKDEDDMDEDERLLASEEGKKLSSKERRQLRNKVSARAFRSRRKEYIGQLEGEVAGKVQEATDLRAENRQLREENTRLTDLTRMLLSSQAFSGFLQELSQSGVPAPSTQTSPNTTAPQSQPKKKDVNPHEASRHAPAYHPQVGMALIPEHPVDLSLFEASSWNPTASTNEFRVYALTQLPEAPILDLEKLSGKGSTPTKSTDASKNLPSISPLPSHSVVESDSRPCVVDDKVALDEKAFDLYFENSQSRSSVSASADLKFELPLNLEVKAALSTVMQQAKKRVEGSSIDLENWLSQLGESSLRLGALLP